MSRIWNRMNPPALPAAEFVVGGDTRHDEMTMRCARHTRSTARSPNGVFVRMTPIQVDYIRRRCEHKARDLLFCRNAHVALRSEMCALRGKRANGAVGRFEGRCRWPAFSRGGRSGILAISWLARGPGGFRSSTSSLRPARARYAAATSPLCPDPMTTASTVSVIAVRGMTGCRGLSARSRTCPSWGIGRRLRASASR